MNSPVDSQDLTPIQLRRIVYAAWEAVLEEWLLHLAFGMPRRLDLCVEAGGDTINY